MFKKIIVAEDIDSISQGLKTAFEKLAGTDVTFSKYCDETFLKIKRAKHDGSPFELLITDLSFKASHMDVKLTSGEQLIKQLKTDNIDIAVVVYSIEERGYNIRYLLDDLNVNGYVSKGRDSTPDLLKAIETVYNGQKYISPHLAHLKKPDGLTDLDETDLEIIKLLSDGFSQTEIGDIFKQEKKKSASFSSVEKRIMKMRTSFYAKNTTHLVSIAKDMGLV